MLSSSTNPQSSSSTSSNSKSKRSAYFCCKSLSAFIKNENGSNPLELYLFVSLGKNKNDTNLQTGSDLDSFIELVNRNRLLSSPVRDQAPVLAISKIRVVLSGDLYSAYVEADDAKKAEEEWRSCEGKKLAAQLDSEFKFDAKTDIWGWDKVSSQTHNPLFLRALERVQALYHEEEDFRKIIDELIPEHVSRYKKKKTHDGNEAQEAVKKYIFGESAVFLSFGKLVCYPRSRFNDAVQYVLRKLKGEGSPPYPGSPYLGYQFEKNEKKERVVNPTNEKNKGNQTATTPHSSPDKQTQRLRAYQSHLYTSDSIMFSMGPLSLLNKLGMFANPQQEQNFLQTIHSLQKQKVVCLRDQLVYLKDQLEFEEMALKAIGQVKEGTSSSTTASVMVATQSSTPVSQ